MFIPRFFYDDGAGDGGGADTITTATAADASTTATAADNNDKPQPFFSADELKELGLDSEASAKERLRQLIAKEKEANIPDEEKLKKENLEKAEFLQYSAKKDLLKVEDYNKYESLKSKADRDLVFESWLPKFKEENPSVSGDDLERLAKEEFEAEYKLDSQNQKTKERGLSRLSKEANEIRTPFETKYKTAYDDFKQDRSIRAKVPDFNKFMDEVIKNATPEKLVVKTKDGEEEVDIEVPLTKEQKEEVERVFKNAKAFNDYSSGDEKKLEELKVKIAKKVEGYYKVNNFEAAVKNGFEKGKGVGIAKGSTAGAENPFALKQSQNSRPTKVITMEESNAKMAEARQRYANNR